MTPLLVLISIFLVELGVIAYVTADELPAGGDR